MSFRRRGEVVNGRAGAAAAGAGTPVNPMLTRSPVTVSTPIANRMLRQPVGRTIPPASTSRPAPAAKPESVQEEWKHPGVKPSIVLSNISCVSTGTKDIDTVLVHGGIPTNCMLLVEEDGSTDFSGVLVKNYVSEGIVQNRKVGKVVNHCIVLGMDASYGSELYDVYAGGRKERKKKLVQDQEGKISVSNINAGNEMKIAWRYGKDAQLNKKRDDSRIQGEEESKYPEYCHQFDITTPLRPIPSSAEMSYISLDGGYDRILSEIEKVINREVSLGKMVRIAVPYMLNPMTYGCEEMVDVDSVTRFVFKMRRLVASHSGKVTLMASISSELYDGDMLDTLESVLFDAALRLVPFPHELNVLLEKVYKTQREKIKQGYVDVLKIALLSGMGLMERREKEFAFKNSKSSFRVEPWSIPVEEEEVLEAKTEF